jgi:glycerophosphoryl diester phosphodiesterase
MKKTVSVILSLAIIMSCAVCALAAGATMSVYSSYKIPTGTMRMIAHAGYSAVAPSNTLPAYEAAGKSDFWGAECDIQRTKDGVWILMHNDTVDDMTDGTGKVSELTYDEIMQFNVDVGSNIENYPDLKVAKLEEYLDVCKKYGLHPVIEIKDNADPEYMREVADILSAREDKDMFYVISFGREICVKMKNLMPSLPVYYLVSYEDVSPENIDFAVNNHLDGMDIHVYHPKDYVKSVVASGLDVFVWTIDDMDNCEKFYKLGVNAITTNSINQEKPEGNVFQQFLWSLRDFWYNQTLQIKTLFGVK